VQLLVLVLIITIVPIIILSYINDQALTENNEKYLSEKVNDASFMVNQVYNEKMKNDQTEAILMSHDLGLISGIKSGNRTLVKLIVDSYFSDAPINYIVTVVDNNGTVIARSATEEYGDVTTNKRLLTALHGNGSSVTDVLPEGVIIANKLQDQISATGMTGGLSLINTEPIRDENKIIIGAISISEVLNNNFDIVDMITNQTGVYCTIFQNDTRIATTLMDAENRRIVGTKALPEIAIPVLFEDRTVTGTYQINNKTLFTHYVPIDNDRGETVGMLFVGYDAEPGYQQLNQMRQKAVITAIVASVVFVIIGYLLVQRITKPIKKIVSIANSIAAGNLDTPVETGASGGEIGELSIAIRQMVGYMVSNIKERINYNEAVLKGISDPMLITDGEGRVTFFNEHASALTGYSSAEAIGQSIVDVTHSGETDGIRESIRKYEVRDFEDTIVTKKGLTAIVRGSSAPLKDADGKAIGTILLLHDITKEREADERIKASLKEKEVLLKEIHHRVKNNLQIISSLLNLQSTYIKDQQSLGMFRESQNRVRSMALIHEKLYQSKDITRIDFAEYIRNLAGNLIRSYGPNPATVKMIIDTDEISLGIDTAIPCGLIINELVTNSLKYAFPDDRSGEIRVSMKHENMGQYRLVVSDNGTGLPGPFDLRETSTLGLQLVATLVDQINGTIEVNNKDGTEFIIRFSEMSMRDTP
jgi:PAS domain S-box